jgi:hypothetical protein
MGDKATGRRIEKFSAADVIAHGREARRRRRPIWTNPFTRERADLWRKGWRRPQDPGRRSNTEEAGRLRRTGFVSSPESERLVLATTPRVGSTM